MRIGKVERFILDELEEHSPQLVDWLAWIKHNGHIECHRGTDPPRSTYESTRRAAHRLEEKELAVCYYANAGSSWEQDIRLWCRLPGQKPHTKPVERLTREEAKEAIVSTLQDAGGKIHRTELRKKVTVKLCGSPYHGCPRTARRAERDLLLDGTIKAYRSETYEYDRKCNTLHYRLNVATPGNSPATQHQAGDAGQ